MDLILGLLFIAVHLGALFGAMYLRHRIRKNQPSASGLGLSISLFTLGE